VGIHIVKPIKQAEAFFYCFRKGRANILVSLNNFPSVCFTIFTFIVVINAASLFVLLRHITDKFETTILVNLWNLGWIFRKANS